MMTRHRNDRGTVAVVVALSSTMIFAVCALGVDLGNGFARKRDIQTQADLAALAAAAHLPADLADDSNNSDIYDAATKYATQNRVAGQVTATWNFSDADETNGYIEFVGANKLRLFAPTSRVDFALAPAAGLPDHMNVSAVAAAEIRSPGRSMPFFVSESCGWNDQTILDQTSGAPAPDYVPVLAPTSSPASSTNLDRLSQSSAEKGATPFWLTVFSQSASGMNGVDRIQFGVDGAPETSNISIPTVGAGNQASVLLTSAILNTDQIWWVRIHKVPSNRWTAPEDALPFVVGDPDADGSCDSKSSGNFGSLMLSRAAPSVAAHWLEENMALGVQHGLESYPAPFPADCSTSVPPAVLDSGTPVDGRLLNCLKTDGGADLQQKATRAFISDTLGGSPAVLAVDGETNKTGVYNEPEGFDYCDDAASPAPPTDREIDINGPGADVPINNDVLSCFITTNDSVGAVSAFSGAPDNVISDAIFDSPRFFWLPVLVDDPSHGVSGSYAIVEFRPVFITDQPDDARRTQPTIEVEGNNGIQMASGNIEKIRVRAINYESLPEFTGDMVNTIAYTGVGTKIVRLVE